MKHLITGCFLILIGVSPLWAQGDTVSVITQFQGQERNYVMYIPKQTTSNRPWPVVLDLHGYAMDAFMHMRISRMPSVADTAQFIVVYPQSAEVENDGKRILDWSLVTNPEESIAFIQHVLQEVQNTYFVNPDRIYATGWNTGGMMCYQLACTMTDKLAAIATVGGTAVRSQVCQPQRPIPVLYVQATMDPLANYQYNSNSYEVLSVQEYLDHWLDMNQCSATSTREEVIAPDSVDVFGGETESWSDCQAAVLRYRPWQKKSQGFLPELDHALHQTTSAKIWSFFREHTNASVTTSTKTRVDDLSSVRVFPNPIKDQLTIRGFLAKAGTITLDISHISGLQIYRERIAMASGDFTLERRMADQVPNGLYFVSLRHNNQIISRKMVRQEP